MNIKRKHTLTLLMGVLAMGCSTLSYGNAQGAVFAKHPSVKMTSVGATHVATTDRPFCKTVPSSALFGRTELFFGFGKPDGSDVTETEFKQFLNQEVTPRFPDGLTVLSGQGQFKGSSGLIEREPSKLLILLYPIDQSDNNSRKIEQIRKSYKAKFQQESVLRTDDKSCVSF